MSRPIRHLYVHVPFCPAKCLYCAFVTHVGSPQRVQPYVDALATEIQSLAGGSSPRALETVYMGGGTPSMLSPQQVARILQTVDRFLGIERDAEITLEAHPSTVDCAKLIGFREVGVTRISVGGESLQPSELAMLGRSHDPARALQVLAEARAAGIRSVNLDLMYGLPGQTLGSWERTLQVLVEARPEHVSLYPLQIEPGTVFGRRHREGRLFPADDELVAEMYAAAVQRLRGHEYDHYEIANWALPGHRSRHNLAYWLDREYLAAGVGAHAYVHPFRTANTRRLGRYLELVESGESPVAEREHIDQRTRLSERVFLGLRLLSDGLDLDALERDFGRSARILVERTARAGIAAGHLRPEGARLYLQEGSVPVANEILDAFVWPSLDQSASA